MALPTLLLLPSVTFMLTSLIAPLPQPSVGVLAQQIDGLAETGRVLYVAAHPDDENTQFLAWAAAGEGYEAAYLSLTRGDGGQNLIGDEQSPLLGVIRTWELLSARSLDGARQFIGAARDFGYSKSAEETLDVWGEEETLDDVVRVIRTFRPHVIVTRFPEEGSTHGHHLASARLARAAFSVAADPDYATDDLAPWQATRLVHNVPTWRGLPEDADTSEWIAVDIGDYQPLYGRSFGEIAAQSRSRHSSQGFGWWSSRGPDEEWLSPIAGPQAEFTLFEGIDTSWAAVPGGADVGTHLADASEAFDARAPEAVIPHLVDAIRALADVEDARLAATAREEITEAIVAAAGLVLDVRAETPTVAVGGEVELTWSALLRANTDARVDAVEITYAETAAGTGALERHAPVMGTTIARIPADAEPSAPYWLATEAVGGRYTTTDASLIGAPIAPPPLIAQFEIEIEGEPLSVSRPVRHIFVDPTIGERVRTLEIVPPVTITPSASVRMLPGGAPATLVLEIEAHAAIEDADVDLGLPDGWTVAADETSLSLASGERRTLRLQISPPANAERVVARPSMTVDGRSWSWRADLIDHPHLPPQLVLRPAAVTMQPVDLAPFAGTVGYVMGSGDVVAASLQEVGVEVRMLAPGELTPETLEDLDAVLIGIRAFNTQPALHDRLPDLLDWVAAGGTLVTQYQTNNRIGALEGPIGPAPLLVARGRVTEEVAEVRAVAPDHPALTAPHAIGPADWSGWVQERGLYFAESWDDAWTPVLSMNDAAEEPLEGSLLVAEVGEGAVVYTGISFFRQLPAGVPGAYRLLLNLLSLGDR